MSPGLNPSYPDFAQNVPQPTPPTQPLAFAPAPPGKIALYAQNITGGGLHVVACLTHDDDNGCSCFKEQDGSFPEHIVYDFGPPPEGEKVLLKEWRERHLEEARLLAALEHAHRVAMHAGQHPTAPGENPALVISP